MDQECPQCRADDSFVLADGRYSCRICGYEDLRRNEYELDDECNFMDFTKGGGASRMMSELKRSVRKSRRRVAGEKKQRVRATIPKEDQVPNVPVSLFEKNYRRRVQPAERDPPGDILPRRHPEVEVWKRVSHRLSTFTQLLARTMRFLVKERMAREEIKPVAMVIFRRLLASQGIAFSDREWTEVEGERYVYEMKRRTAKKEIVATVAEQREAMASQMTTQTEELRTGAMGGEDSMWEMLMSERVTEQLSVAAPAGTQGERLKTKRKYVYSYDVERKETSTSKDAMTRAGIVTLSVELLVAISSLACAVVGAEVEMGELIRWYREARIPLPPHFLHDLVKIKLCDDGKMVQMESCGYERHFNFYLHECASVLQRVVSITRVPRRRIERGLDELVARHLAHLNLPFALMERALAVLSLARVETVEMERERAEEEEGYCNEKTCKFGMEEGRVHPMLSTSYRAPFVIFSPDTRAMAVILLVLRMSGWMEEDREEREEKERQSARHFSFPAWLRQLRARMRVYGGDEGEGVVRESFLRPSSSSSPADYTTPMSMQMNRTDLVLSYGKLMYRQSPRANFPYGFDPLPKLDGNRYLFKDGLPFPEDGETIRAGRGEQAARAPLMFHGERVREELERGMRGGEEREWREAVKEMGRGYEDQIIEGLEEELFPAEFETSSLPNFAVSSLVKMDNKDMEHDRYMIGGGQGDIVFAYLQAAPTLTQRHRWMIHSMSRLLVEAPAVLYAACTMLERRVVGYEKCLSLIQQLESGSLVRVEECAVSVTKRERLIESELVMRRVEGGACNLIEVVEVRNAYEDRKSIRREKRRVRREREERMEGMDREDEGEEKEMKMRDQKEEEEESEEGEEEEGDDAELGETEEEREEEEEEERFEDGEEREEEGEDEVEVVDEDPNVEHPCERYTRSMDYYRPIVQKKYYINFEYLWSILAMRMW